MKNLIKNFIRNIFFYFGINISEKSDENKIEDFFKLFRPNDLGYDLIRIGSKNDGGYLIPNMLDKITSCISPGVGHTNSFESDLLIKGIKSFMIDHTIEENSLMVEKFNFTKKKIKQL